MNAAPCSQRTLPERKSWLPSAVAREAMLAEGRGPLWVADWDRVLMLHWSAPAEALQAVVPFPLDLHEGKGWVSAVAFTLRGMKRSGWRWRLPFTSHEFLNLRAYVRVGDDPGIFFLREWVPWRPTVALSRPLYGLPFTAGRLRYDHWHERGQVRGQVEAAGSVLEYEAMVGPAFDVCGAGTLTEFLMERYTAFTEWRGWRRRFEVWHPPWRQCMVEARVRQASLLNLTGDWAAQASFEGAHYSPGLPAVWMGAPRWLRDQFEVTSRHP